MSLDRTTKSRRLSTLLQLTVISFVLVFIFAIAYWSLASLGLGGLQNRNGEHVVEFLPCLYFSVETFFRIGYGAQIPVGLAWAVVALEAMAHFLLEVVFIAHMAILGLHKLVSLSDRSRLEDILHRF